MTRRIAVLLCAAVVALAGWGFAQEPGGDDLPEPPVKLKRKQRPPADAPKDEKLPPVEGKKGDAPKDDAKKDDAKKDDARKDDMKKDDDLPDDGDMPEEDEKEILNRVGKNMRLSEDRLANKELGEGTRQVQDDIVKDLDKLIKLAQQPPQGGEQDQQPQGGGGGGGQQQQKQAGGQRKQGGQMRMRQGQGQGQQQASGRRQRGQRGRGQQMARGNQGGQQGQGQQQEPAHMGGNNPGGGGNTGGQDPNKIADLYKDIWGHLPETMRAEMNAYGRERFMTKYEELIRRYYTTAAEKSRKKGE
ncbi:MAG TPA: hypothetical protein VFA26_08440 [Gemmataceae bacterium]|nr:hypothetical protein [Gemmataceae bacterium]